MSEAENRLYELEQHVNNINAIMPELINCFRHQKDLNIQTYKEIDMQLDILKLHQDIIKDFQKAIYSFRHLLTENEVRLKNIEEYISNPAAKGIDAPSTN